MALSDKAMINLTSALREDVIDYIHADERYVMFMQEMIHDAVREKLGQIDDDVMGELALMIMDSMCLR